MWTYKELEHPNRLLEITLVLTSDNTFDVEIYEPETGEIDIVKCHDSGPTVEQENYKIAEEIRSWISIMRDCAEYEEEEE